jgi:hypothetical protein
MSSYERLNSAIAARELPAWPSHEQGKQWERGEFNQALRELRMTRRSLRKFCFSRLGFRREDVRRIRTEELAAIFLLSKNRCPIDGGKLVQGDEEICYRLMCPQHIPLGLSYSQGERGEQIRDNPDNALSLVREEILYPQTEGLMIIKEIRGKTET